MTADLGKRAAHKIATRNAIQAAADELFGARGYADTTVREIADAAGVTERTFFRYFPVKEALLVKDVQAWLPMLGEEIRRRPAEESPLDAVENAFFALAGQLREGTRPNVSWLFHDGPPGPKLEKSTPGLLLRFEREVADAILTRMGHAHGASSPDEVFTSQVIARSAISALRSAGIRHWQLGDAKMATSLEAGSLIRQAFAILRQL